jgi:hypothetical protein
MGRAPKKACDAASTVAPKAAASSFAAGGASFAAGGVAAAEAAAAAAAAPSDDGAAAPASAAAAAVPGTSVDMPSTTEGMCLYLSDINGEHFGYFCCVREIILSRTQPLAFFISM